MKIATPQTSIFNRPDLQQLQSKPAYSSVSTAHFSAATSDSFARQIPAKPQLTFSGRNHKQSPDPIEQLRKQFPSSFQPIVQRAVKKANENKDSELTAEHLVWAAIKTLDDMAKTPSRNTRSNEQENQERIEKAQMLTEALLPTHPHISPHDAAELLKPLANKLEREFAESSTEKMDLDEPANLGIQRNLQKEMRKAFDGDEAHIEPQALFQKILWQEPPIPNFAQLSAKAKQCLNSPTTSSSSSSPRPGTPNSQESLDIANAARIDSDWQAFHASLKEKNPTLANWVRQSTRTLNNNPNLTGTRLAPLPQIVASGIEQAKFELSPTGKRPSKKDSDKSPPAQHSLNALVPITDSSLKAGKTFLTDVLERHREALQAMPKPQNREQAETRAQRSRQVIEQFFNQPGRNDYSIKAFVDYLKDEEAAASPLAPAEHAAVGQALTNLLNEAQDTRMAQMEQFEKAVPALRKHGGKNMVRQAMNKQLSEALMHHVATERMLAVLNSSADNNILLNAPYGKDKTYAVQGLAQRIANNEVPKELQGAQMVQLSAPALENHSRELITQLNNYLANNPKNKVILFVDEAHSLDDARDTLNASGILEKKNFSFIAATTPDDRKKSGMQSDEAFLAHFQDVPLPAFSNKKEQLTILGTNSAKMAEDNGVEVPLEVLELVLDQATAKWPANPLHQAASLLGLAISLTKDSALEQAALKDELKMKKLWLNTLQSQSDLKGRFVRQITETKDEIDSLHKQLKKMDGQGKAEHPKVGDKQVRQAMAIRTGELIGTLSENELDKINNAKEVLSRSIIGQDEALGLAHKCLQNIAVHQESGATRKRPIASMFLCGPTGVGKTELSEVIAREFMNNNYLRLNMSLYGEAHEVSKILGSPPGYVGHDNGGSIDQIRQSPNMVVVFDEIEKAHEKIYDILLPILDKGEIEDNRGDLISFRDAFVIVTSNLKNEQITKLITQMRNDPAKRKDPTLAERELERQVKDMLVKKTSQDHGFKPEQLERFDAIIPFSPLSKRSVSQIMDLRVRELNEAPRLINNNLTVELSDSARERLIELASAGSKPIITQDAPNANPHSTARSNARKKPEVSDEDTLLPGGARSVGKTFEQYITNTVFLNLRNKPNLKDIANARLIVDYDPKTQTFQAHPKAEKLVHRRPSFMDCTPTGRTLTFA